MTTTGNVTDPNQRLLRFLSATAEQQAAIDRILSGQMQLHAAAAEPPKGPLLMMIKDAAALLGVHRATIWRLVKAGRLQTVELLGSLRVRRADLELLAQGHQACGHQAQGHQAAGHQAAGHVAQGHQAARCVAQGKGDK